MYNFWTFRFVNYGYICICIVIIINWAYIHKFNKTHIIIPHINFTAILIIMCRGNPPQITITFVAQSFNFIVNTTAQSRPCPSFITMKVTTCPGTIKCCIFKITFWNFKNQMFHINPRNFRDGLLLFIIPFRCLYD